MQSYTVETLRRIKIVEKKTKLMKACLFIFILITISNCKTNERYSYLKAESIIKKDISVDSKLILYDNGNAAYLIDSHDGKRFGNLFSFYTNSYLSGYSFMTDSVHDTYTETFDSITHKIIQIEGSPVVYKTVDGISHPDSMFVQYLISNFSYDDISFQVSDSGRNFEDLPLKDNLGIYSKMKFLNASYFIKDVKNIKRFYLISKFTGRLKNTSDRRIYYDTIDLTKNIP